MLDGKLYHQLSSEGFKHTDWSRIPDELLVYLFLHDEPTLGKTRTINTKKGYLRDIHQFINFTGTLIRNLDSSDLLAYQKFCEEQGVASTTLRKRSSVIKQFFSYLYKQGVLSADITNKMKRVSQPLDKKKNRDVYYNEVQQLLQHFEETDFFAYTMLMLLASTGIRINELATAKWSSLFVFNVHGQDYTFITVLGKGNKPRDILILEDVFHTIVEFRMRRSKKTSIDPNDTTAFFCKSDGSHYTSEYLSTEFSNIVSQSPFSFISARKDRITPHSLRHYFAAALSDKGVDLRAIQDALGHANIQTTEGYLRRKRKLESHAGIKLGHNFRVGN